MSAPSITQIRQALAAAAATAEGCAGESHRPTTINQRTAVVYFAGLNPTRETGSRGVWRPRFTVTVYEPLKGNQPDAEARLDTVITFGHAGSVIDALEADRRLGGLVATLDVESVGEYQLTVLSDRQFVTVDLEVAVLAST